MLFDDPQMLKQRHARLVGLKAGDRIRCVYAAVSSLQPGKIFTVAEVGGRRA